MSRKNASYGFVYIWFDRKHKRYYIGSHWGSENDGYICSSKWMNRSYCRRPEDFKRRIVSWVYTTRKELLNEEYRWLQMIKPEKKKRRYYNLRIGPDNRNWSNNGFTEERRRKMSESAKRRHARELLLGTSNLVNNKGRKFTEEHRRRLCDSRINRKITKETRRKLSEAEKNRKFTEEHRRKLSEAQKHRHTKERQLGIISLKGQRRTEEVRNKISKANKGKKFTEEHRRKLSEAAKRRHAQERQLEAVV